MSIATLKARIIYASVEVKRMSETVSKIKMCTDAKFRVKTSAREIPTSKKLMSPRKALKRFGFMWAPK